MVCLFMLDNREKARYSHSFSMNSLLTKLRQKLASSNCSSRKLLGPLAFKNFVFELWFVPEQPCSSCLKSLRNLTVVE